MALSFPGGPTPGQVYAAPNGVSYTWNNTVGVWTAESGGAAVGRVVAYTIFSSNGGFITPINNFNVSSVTYNSTGDYTVNFTTALSTADYVWSFGLYDSPRLMVASQHLGSSTKTTTQFEFITWRAADSSVYDVDYVSLTFVI